MTEAFVEPAYGSRSLADVLPAVATAVGSPLAGAVTGLELPTAQSYVIFLIDGLGSELLRRHAAVAPFLSSLLAKQEPATAGVPSTTVTSLTSLGTGLAPGAHGLVGYTSRIPGTDRLLNALQWDSSVDPLQWQPHTTAFAQLQAGGVIATVVNKREFLTSGLTSVAHRGASFVGANLVGERIAAAVSSSSRSPSVTYVYDSDLDWTGHKFGVSSTQWIQQLATVDSHAEQLRDSLAPGTRLLVIADHGMVDSPPESRVDIDAEPVLRDGVSLVGGEARFRHLYCAPGAEADVVQTWREVMGGRATVLSRSEAIGRGWFGLPDDHVLPRIGDVVVACRDDVTVVATKEFSYEAQMIGFHGSLTPAEMLIPLLVV